MLDSDKKIYPPSLSRFFERFGSTFDNSYDSQDNLGPRSRSFSSRNQTKSLIQSMSPHLVGRSRPVKQKLRRRSLPENQHFKLEDDTLRNKTAPINHKRLTFLQTSEIAGIQGENYCFVDEVPVKNKNDAIQDESYTAEPSCANGVKTYMCIVCGKPLFLANKKLGMYDLVSLSFSKPIRSGRQYKSFVTSFSTSLYSQTEKRSGHVKFQCSNCNVNVGHIYDRKLITHSLFRAKEGDFVDNSTENVKYCEQLEARNFVVI